MSKKPASFVFLVAAAIGVQQYLGSEQTEPGGESGAAAEGSAPAAALDRSAGFSAICDLLAREPAGFKSCAESFCANRNFNWVIATVPDPNRTTLRLSFDRYIESIQRGAEDSGYAFLRHWLPWKLKADGRSMKNPPERCIQSLPGVLAFRNRSADGAPLLIFIVAETPTTGIDAAQFEAAVALGQRSTQKHAPLRVIGPSFSGSFPSLEALITRAGAKDSAEVVTGSATDACSRADFKSRIAGFRAVVHTDRDLLRSLLAHIHDHWSTLHRRMGDIAIISEADTAYGAQFNAKVAGLCPGETDVSLSLSGSLAKGPRFHFIRYPRDLARLRNVYNEPAAPRRPVDASTEAAQGAPVTFKDAQEASDTLPTFSQQKPASQEAILAGIASTLARERVRYAIITASDTLDLLFVSRYLRVTVPDVRLFTLGTDVLFSHGSDAHSFGGMLAASTYPMVASNHHWTDGDGFANSRGFYAGTYAQATYSAARVVVSHAAGLKDGEFELPEYRPPFSAGKTPAMWLTALAVSGYQPVALLHAAPVADAGLYQGSDDTRANVAPVVDRPSVVWMTICFFTFGAAVLLIILVNHPGSATSRSFSVLALKTDEYAGRTSRGFYLLCLQCSVALLVAMFTYPPLMLVLHVTKHDLQLPGLAGLTVILLAAGVAATQAAGAQRSLRKRRRMVNPWLVAGIAAAPFVLIWLARVLPKATPGEGIPLWALGIAALGTAIVVALLTSAVGSMLVLSTNPRSHSVWSDFTSRLQSYPYRLPLASVFALAVAGLVGATLCAAAPDEQGFFFAYRSLSLTTGASPLVPFLFLAAALCYWSIAQLRRVTYHEDRCPILPVLECDVLCPGLVHLENEVKLNIRRPFYSQLEMIGALVMIPVIAVLFPFATGTQMYEHFSIEASYFVLLLAATVLTIYSWARFLMLWKLVREVLQQLERHPVRFAFDSLRAAYGWAPIWQGSGGKRRTHVVFTRSLECLRRITQLNVPAMTKLVVEDAISRVEPPLKNLLTASAQRRRVLPVEYRQIQATFSGVGTYLVGALQPSWNVGDPQKTFTSEDRSLNDNASFVMHQFLALRFLPYISYLQLQLQNLLLCFTTMFVLSVFSLQSYPFQSQHRLGWIWIIMFLVFAVGVITVFAQLDRDPILSRIAGTEAGKLDSGFVRRVLSFGALPLLSLIASQFPGVGRQVLALVEPAMQMLR